MNKRATVIILMVAVLPQVTLAELPGGQASNTISHEGLKISLETGDLGTVGRAFNTTQSKGFENPLGITLHEFIIKIINFLLGLVGLFALLALIVGGIRMVMSFGNDQAVASAKNIIKWAIIGLIIIILSWAIVRVLTNQLFGIQ